MFYLALYTVFIMAVGFILGVITKEHIDKEAIREVTAENRKLHRENANLKKHEVIEIVDRTAEPKSYFEPF